MNIFGQSLFDVGLVEECQWLQLYYKYRDWQKWFCFWPEKSFSSYFEGKSFTFDVDYLRVLFFLAD